MDDFRTHYQPPSEWEQFVKRLATNGYTQPRLVGTYNFRILIEAQDRYGETVRGYFDADTPIDYADWCTRNSSGWGYDTRGLDLNLPESRAIGIDEIHWGVFK